MICAVLIDPDDSPDFSGDGAEVMGRPLAAYPLIAAKGSRYVARLYTQASSSVVARVAAQYGAASLTPPRVDDDARLADEALIAHAWRQVVDDLKAEKTAPELAVILFANSGAVSTALIDQGISALLDDLALDSAVTVSCYERWTPGRAFRETPAGRLTPYSERAPEAGAPWFPDWGAVVVRPRVLDALSAESPSLAYLGHNVLPLKQIGGGPVDRDWQVPKLEYWLKKQGVADNPRHEPQLQPKLKPKPKPRPETDER